MGNESNQVSEKIEGWTGECRGKGDREGQWEGTAHFSCPLPPTELRAWWQSLARQIQVRDVESLGQLED